MTPNQFDRDKLELGWRVATALWLENRATGPKFIGDRILETEPLSSS